MKNQKQTKQNDAVTTSRQVMQVPLLDLEREYQEMAPEIERALLNAAAASRYIMGPEVSRLEAEICAYLGIKHCRGVASGTDALVIALRALAIKNRGEEYFSSTDEIITTPFTFIATAGSILRSGATPVFVDIDPATYNIDVGKIAEAITPKTVGIIPVHLYGLPCPMDEIIALASAHNLFVLEDVAQAFGAVYKGRKAGSIGDLGAFSFFPSKNLGAFGDAGMISTADDELAHLAAMLARHGGVDKYNVEHIGYNSRLDTIQAAILLVKLKHVDRLNQLRRQVAQHYNKQLSNLPWLELPVGNASEHVYHQYTVRIKDGKRDQVQEQLRRQGIASAVYYPVPLHNMKTLAGRCQISGQLTEAERACTEVLSLPVEPLFSKEEIQAVIDALNSVSI